MMFTGIEGTITEVTRQSRRARMLAELATPERFRWLIQREIHRADRIDIGCALVIFWPEAVERSREPAQWHLARALRARARITDEVGLMEDGALGVLLAHTQVEGARRFAEDVRLTVRREMPRLRYVIYSYPFDGDG